VAARTPLHTSPTPRRSTIEPLPNFNNARDVAARPVQPSKAADIDAVANYWKRRDEWGPPWGNGPEDPTKGLAKRTVDAVTKLGATPPVLPGQLEKLALAVIGGPAFGAHALWAVLQ
jgi:hypothetical protein